MVQEKVRAEVGAGLNIPVFILYRGKRLKRGIPFQKQGISGRKDVRKDKTPKREWGEPKVTGNELVVENRPQEKFYILLVLKAPPGLESDEVFPVVEYSVLYDYRNDPDVTDPYTGEMRTDRPEPHRPGDAMADGKYDPTKSRAANAKASAIALG